MSGGVTVSIQDQILRLALATILGGIIGWEREKGRRPAGLRTHILVAVGSALVMIVSQSVVVQYSDAFRADPGRIAAQVVSGIGFLGAGTILREGPVVRGLTTAASLWVVAALGLAVGIGAYTGAVIATALTLAALVLLQRIEKNIQRAGGMRVLRLRVKDQPGQLGLIGSVLGAYQVDIRGIELNPINDNLVELELSVRHPPSIDLIALVNDLRGIDGVDTVGTEEPS